MPDITSILHEKRLFKPSSQFSKSANIKSLAEYQRLYKDSIKNPEKFWAKQAMELTWFKPWKKTLQWKPPFAQWFVGGKINASYNCVDRHLKSWRKNKAAIIWEGENGEQRVYTYMDLYREVCSLAN